MSDLAGDVAAVLDGLSIPRVHYIGLSIGGMLARPSRSSTSSG
jgi:pimeloyl-ACP methyl ester carboxylesterase